MSVKKQDVCRVCLKMIEKNFGEIDDVVRRILNILLLKLDLDITRDPIICKNCMELAKNCLLFKYTYINTEKIILSFSSDDKRPKYNIKVIYTHSKLAETIVSEPFGVCRFCLTHLEIDNFVSLKTLRNDAMFEKLTEYMPELDFDIIENPIMCVSCRENLEVYFKFVLNCLDIEAKIDRYCRNERTDRIDLVELDTLHFLFRDVLEYTIKVESNTFEDTECLYPEANRNMLKLEALNSTEEEIEHLFYDDTFNTGIDKSIVCSDELKQKNNIRNDSLTSNCTFMKKHNCMLCTYRTKQKSNLTRHMLVHKNTSELKKYKCPFCTYGARQKNTLERHMLVHKDASETDIYKCLFCGYETKRKDNLKSHMFVHKDVSETEMYKCSLCAYKCKQKCGLKKHMIVHMDIVETQMYKCSKCDYETNHSGSLKSHMLVHKNVSQIKMHKCSICPYETKLNGNLKKHMLVHKDVSEVKTFKCSLCSYETKHNNSLKLHMLVHKNVSEIEMHKCSLCTYESRQKCNLKRHMSVHKATTKIKTYKCSSCNYEAKQKYYFKKHMLVHIDVLGEKIVHRVCSIINMDVKKQQVCRLCLKLARDEYWEINELFKQIFDTLLLDLDLDITRDPIACQDCVEVAKNCLRFKYVCIGTEKIILSFCHDKKEIKYNIKIIYEGSKDICRFCMVPLKRNKFVSLDTFMNETRCEVLSKYMPEMDFNIIENPMICTSCRKKVNSFLKFVLNCVGTEEKVKAYCKEGGSNSRGQLKLDNIPHFFIKNVLKYPENGPKVLAIKEKTNTFYNKGCVHSDFTSGSINLEDYEIKKDETNFEAKSFKNLKNRTSKSLSKDIPETQKFKCGSCSYETKLKSNLKSHMLVHRDVSQVQMLKCSFCSYESKRKSNLKIHMLIHDEFLEAKLYKCPLCTYEAKEKRKINRHMLVHKDVSEIKMHKCSLCDYEAKQKSYLKSHMLVHKDISEVQMYKCPLCTHETKHKGLIKKHMLVHKNVSELKMYKCSLCVYETKYKSALKTHTYVIHKGVSEIEMHKCSLCPYESKQKVSLKRHMLVHKDVSEMQMYKCSLCPYEAKHKGYLRRHMSVHKDDAERKMYKCLLCSYEAKQNSSLNKHMSLHMDFSEIKI